MSRPVAIVVDVARLRAVTDASDGSVLEMPWDPTVPADALTRLRDMFGAPSAVLLIVGVGFLEIARPELPPLASDARHALLMRDADRYFPTSVQAAAAWSDGLAFAMPALTLDSWVRAFSELGPIDGVITIPEACAEAFDDCVVATDGGHGEMPRLKCTAEPFARCGG